MGDDAGYSTNCFHCSVPAGAQGREVDTGEITTANQASTGTWRDTRMSADKPRVAVLMAVCNGLPWIEEQIESILAQKGVQLDLYISVDESADNTESFCTELESKEPRVRVLQGSGPGSACGNFVRLMREVSTHSYEYIALADQDDIWQDDKVVRGISCLENMAADAYSSSFIAFWGTTGQQRFIDKSAPQREYDYLFESPGPGCSFILKPHLVEHFALILEIPVWQIFSV